MGCIERRPTTRGQGHWQQRRALERGQTWRAPGELSRASDRNHHVHSHPTFSPTVDNRVDRCAQCHIIRVCPCLSSL